MKRYIASLPNEATIDDYLNELAQFFLSCTTNPITIHNSGEPFLIWQSKILLNTYAFRFTDYSSCSIDLIKKKSVAPAITLLRSNLELTSHLSWLLIKYQNAISDLLGYRSELSESLDRLMYGSKNDKTSHVAVNVLTTIDKLDALFPGTRIIYDDLSEYAHPNYRGISGNYSVWINCDTKSFTNKSIHKDSIPITALHYITVVFTHLSADLEDSIDLLTKQLEMK